MSFSRDRFGRVNRIRENMRNLLLKDTLDLDEKYLLERVELNNELAVSINDKYEQNNEGLIALNQKLTDNNEFTRRLIGQSSTGQNVIDDTIARVNESKAEVDDLESRVDEDILIRLEDTYGPEAESLGEFTRPYLVEDTSSGFVSDATRPEKFYYRNVNLETVLLANKNGELFSREIIYFYGDKVIVEGIGLYNYNIFSQSLVPGSSVDLPTFVSVLNSIRNEFQNLLTNNTEFRADLPLPVPVDRTRTTTAVPSSFNNSLLSTALGQDRYVRDAFSSIGSCRATSKRLVFEDFFDVLIPDDLPIGKVLDLLNDGLNRVIDVVNFFKDFGDRINVGNYANNDGFVILLEGINDLFFFRQTFDTFLKAYRLVGAVVVPFLKAVAIAGDFITGNVISGIEGIINGGNIDELPPFVPLTFNNSGIIPGTDIVNTYNSIANNILSKFNVIQPFLKGLSGLVTDDGTIFGPVDISEETYNSIRDQDVKNQFSVNPDGSATISLDTAFDIFGDFDLKESLVNLLNILLPTPFSKLDFKEFVKLSETEDIGEVDLTRFLEDALGAIQTALDGEVPEVRLPLFDFKYRYEYLATRQDIENFVANQN